MSNRIEQLLRPGLRSLQAYHVPPASDVIKLDAMENPFALPPALQAKWIDMMRLAALNRYPDASADSLRRGLHKVLGLPAGHDLLLGNGSDELIQLLCLALIDSPVRKDGSRPVLLAPEPGFAMYRLLAVATGLDYVGVPLQRESFALDMSAMQEAIERHKPELIFLAYPNNPTGNLFAIDDLQRIATLAPGLVIIDEAYHPFACRSAIGNLQQHSHVLLLRTLSKLGLAGIRLGILAGHPDWIQQLNKLRLPYNINTLTQLTTAFFCEHHAAFVEQAEEIRNQRELLFKKLTTIDGIRPYPSQANFILFQCREGQAGRIFSGLLQQRVLIKNIDASSPLLRNCLRVTVGTVGENEKFIEALMKSLQ